MKRSCPVLIAGALAVLATPFFLHRRFRVLRREVILEPAAAVFPFVVDVRNWTLWAPWIHAADAEFSPETVGSGAFLRWNSAWGRSVLRVHHTLPDQRMAVRVELGDRFEIEGILSLENLGDATRMTWVATWQTNGNPWLRYLDIALRAQLCRDFAQGLERLKNLIECKPQV